MDQGPVGRHGAQHGPDIRASAPAIAEATPARALIKPAHPIFGTRESRQNGFLREKLLLENLSSFEGIIYHLKQKSPFSFAVWLIPLFAAFGKTAGARQNESPTARDGPFGAVGY